MNGSKAAIGRYKEVTPAAAHGDEGCAKAATVGFVISCDEAPFLQRKVN